MLYDYLFYLAIIPNDIMGTGSGVERHTISPGTLFDYYGGIIYANNHSKVLLVRSEKGEVVSIVTSQNLTRGNRCESAFITTDLAIFNTLHGQVEDLIKNHSVPLNDLFSQRLAK